MFSRPLPAHCRHIPVAGFSIQRGFHLTPTREIQIEFPVVRAWLGKSWLVYIRIPYGIYMYTLTICRIEWVTIDNCLSTNCALLIHLHVYRKHNFSEIKSSQNTSSRTHILLRIIDIFLGKCWFFHDFSVGPIVNNVNKDEYYKPFSALYPFFIIVYFTLHLCQASSKNFLLPCQVLVNFGLNILGTCLNGE